MCISIFLFLYYTSCVSFTLLFFFSLSEEWKIARPVRPFYWGGGGGGSPNSLAHHLSHRAVEGVGCPLPHKGAFAIFTLKWSDLMHTWGECGPYFFVCFAGGRDRANPLGAGLNFNIKYRPHFKVGLHKVCNIHSIIMESTKNLNTAQML